MQVLRFSRLFPPHYPVSLYKKKRKVDEPEKLVPQPLEGKEMEIDWGPAPEPENLMKDGQVVNELDGSS